MKRVTIAEVRRMMPRLNAVLGRPVDMFKPGPMKSPPDWNPGHIYLDGAYGGWRLEEVAEGGGCRRPFNHGYRKPKEVLTEIWTIITTAEEIKRNKS